MPNSLMAPIHHWMSVILPDSEYDACLAVETEPETLRDLLVPREWADLAARPVSKTVNRAGADGPQLIDTVVNASRKLL